MHDIKWNFHWAKGVGLRVSRGDISISSMSTCFTRSSKLISFKRTWFVNTLSPLFGCFCGSLSNGSVFRHASSTPSPFPNLMKAAINLCRSRPVEVLQRGSWAMLHLRKVNDENVDLYPLHPLPYPPTPVSAWCSHCCVGHNDRVAAITFCSSWVVQMGSRTMLRYNIIKLCCPRGEIPLAAMWKRRNITWIWYTWI